jgi:hypothetical protein
MYTDFSNTATSYLLKDEEINEQKPRLQRSKKATLLLALSAMLGIGAIYSVFKNSSQD